MELTQTKERCRLADQNYAYHSFQMTFAFCRSHLIIGLNAAQSEHSMNLTTNEFESILHYDHYQPITKDQILCCNSQLQYYGTVPATVPRV